MNTVALTGEVRYRVQTRLFRRPLLVLQVEERHTGITDIDGPAYDYYKWRDASTSDLQTKVRKPE